MQYRSDIDGLRAISVCSVVVYHAFPSALPGGFVGVDIFFTISGFLITRLIIEKLREGTFTISEFYFRRIRRIFPALALVLLATLALGYGVLWENEYSQLGLQVLSGALFFINFVLYFQVGYFDVDATTKPLLHLWSLAIEEQFYIFWPLAIMLAWKYRRLLIGLFFVAIVLSFSANLLFVDDAPNFVFYMPFTRVWELAAGGALAWYGLQGNGALDRKVHDLLSVVGLGLIVVSVVLLDSQMNYPGVWGGVPVVGALLVIGSGANSLVNRAVLGRFKLLIWFGLISYPLYLWHWPLLSYLRILSGDAAPVSAKIFLIGLAIVLSWLTYVLIEKPVRTKGRLRTKAWSLAGMMSAVAICGAALLVQDGLPERPVNVAKTSGNDGGTGDYLVSGCGTSMGPDENRFTSCRQDRRGDVKFALIGDSKASAMFSGLVRESVAEGRWLELSGWSPALGAPVPMYTPGQNNPIETAINEIGANPDIEVVILVTAIRALFGIDAHNRPGTKLNYNHTYLADLRERTSFDRQLQGVSNTVEAFIARGKKVVFVVDNPALPHPADCHPRQTSWFINSLFPQYAIPEDCNISLDVYLENTSVYRSLVSALKDKFPSGFYVFDPTPIYCSMTLKVCGPQKKERALYAYTDHISDYASGLVGGALNPFLIGLHED